MATLQSLLARVPDEKLRAELAAAIAEANSTAEFGLVFEKHLPETVRLPHHPIRRGVKVGHRNVGSDRSVFDVIRISDGKATLVRGKNPDGTAVDRDAEPEMLTESLDNLVVVAEFGDPIYPGLNRLGSIDRGGDKPYHVVINAENHHALEMLRFTHAGKVDCIYIDPPYNTGARDWKYDNDYVDAEDAYRHSKWLAFMDRRLRLAKELLNPEGSVLIVTIDENEVHRLALVLEDIFAGARIQMVSIVNNPSGAGNVGINRVDEYAFFVAVGGPTPFVGEDDYLNRAELASQNSRMKGGLSWESFLRSGTGWYRESRPTLCYPILIDRESMTIVGMGQPFSGGSESARPKSIDGQYAAWPVRKDGKLGIWRTNAGSLQNLVQKGYAYVSSFDAGRDTCTIKYLLSGTIKLIESGKVPVQRSGDRGQVVAPQESTIAKSAKSVWFRPAHNAGKHGSDLMQALIPGRRFPFPKRLYAVEDCVRLAVSRKPSATILDFFGGSGTTTHAVARLNRQDGGSRQSILVTNNEVSADESKSLSAQGLRDGDSEWEAVGIFEHIARPRITAAVTGLTAEGKPVKGDYRFTDEFPMDEGFEENVEFLELTYQDTGQVELDLAFNAIAPMLWLRAGAQGPLIEERCDESGRRKAYEWTDRYGVLFDTDRWSSFVAEMPESVTTAFLVTDSMTTFAQVSGELPGHLDTVRLYERYVTTFAINTDESR